MDENKLKVIITAQIQDFVKKLDTARQKLNQFNSEVNNDSKTVQDDLDNVSLSGLKAALAEAQERAAQFEKEIASWQSVMKQNEADLESYKKKLEELGNATGSMSPNEWIKQYTEAQQAIKEIPELNKEWANKVRQVKRELVDVNREIKKYQKEIAKAEKATAKAKDETSKIGKAVNGLFSIVKRMLIRRAVMAVISELKEGIDILAKYDSSLGNTLGYNKALSDLTSSFKRLSVTLAAVASELLVALGPALNTILDLLNKVAEGLSMFLAMFNGKTQYTVANPDYWKDYAKGLEETVKAQRKLIGGFDELNTFTSSQSSSSLINPADIAMVKELPDWMKKIAEFNKKLKEENLSILKWLALLALLAAAIALLNKLFNRKNGLLGRQTKATEAETSAVGELVPQYALATAAVYALADAFDLLPSFLPDLVPNIELQPAYEALESFKEKLGNLQMPALQPSFQLEPNTSLALGELKERIRSEELPEMQPRFSWETVEAFFEKVKAKWGALKTPQLVPAFNISPILTALATVATAFQTFFADNSAKLKNLVTEWKTEWNAGLNEAKQRVNEWATNFNTQMNTATQNAKQKIIDWANVFIANIKSATQNAKQNIVDWVTVTSKNLANWASNTATNVANAVTNWAKNIYTALTNAGNNINSWIQSTSKNFANWAKNTAGNIANWATNIVTNISNALQVAWEKFKSFMQATGQAISTWWNNGGSRTTITTLAVAAAVTLGAIALAPYTGGASLGFIPAAVLANGGVVDKPTYAMVGEYAGAKTNPEIVTPENKMREVLKDNNGTLIEGFAQMTRQIISAINDVDMEVSIGDDVIARSAQRGNRAYQRMTGTPLITT